MDVAAGPAEVQALVAAPEPDVPEPGVQYAGLATRVISFAIDAAVLNLVAIIASVGAALILSILHLPSDVKTVLGVIGGVVYFLWLVGYFVVFWSTTGQTPGARVMQIRVVTTEGNIPGPKRSLVRWVGVILAALPLFAGFVRILFDPRRRGFQDRLAGTVVVEASQPSLIIARFGRSPRSGDDRAPVGEHASPRA